MILQRSEKFTMTSTTELKTLANQFPWLRRYFIGVFSIDTLPTTISSYPTALIINSDPSHLPGQHWVALFVENETVSEYFDPYGLSPIDEIFRFSKRVSRTLIFNKWWIQHPVSSNCGLYCIYFLVARTGGVKFEEFVNYFKDYDWKRNESVLEKWIQSKIYV